MLAVCPCEFDAVSDFAIVIAAGDGGFGGIPPIDLDTYDEIFGSSDPIMRVPMSPKHPR